MHPQQPAGATTQTASSPAATVLTLLGSEADRPLLCTALALTRGTRRRLTAWCLPDPAQMLAERLRATMLGMRGNSEADRALRYMVESSIRGHHVPIRHLPQETQAFSEQIEELRALPEDSLLVTGWTRGGAVPSGRSFATIIREHPGSLLVVMAVPQTPFSAALLVSLGAATGPEAQLQALAESLEDSYPCWLQEAPTLDGLEPLLSEARENDLVIVSAANTKATEIVPLLDRLRPATGGYTAAILLPPGGDREQLLSWLAAH